LLCSVVDSAYFTLSGDELVTVRAGFDDGSFCQNSVVEHAHNGAVYFYQFGARDLWFKDLSGRAPKIIESSPAIDGQSVKRNYASIGRDLYIATESFGVDSAFYRFDNSEQELLQLSIFNDHRLLGLHQVGNQLFLLLSEYVSDSSSGGLARVDLLLWKFTSGVSTTLVRRLKGQGDNDGVKIWNEGSRLYFQLFFDGSLFHSNGTSDSTYPLTYFVPYREITAEQAAASKIMIGIHLLLLEDEEPKQQIIE
jgi:hypothetical protein